MRARAFTIAAALLAAACVSAEPGASTPFEADANRERWLQRLDRSLETGGLRGARVSALVVRERDGAILFEREPDRMMIPASNAKVLTALAALDAFGPTHRFETRLLSNAPLANDGAVQDLIVVGGGDPALTNEDYWRMAAELREAGLTRVSGNIVVDDSLFDRTRWHPSVKGVSSRAYHAPVGALAANYSSFAVTVEPAAVAGGLVAARLTPPVDYLVMKNETKTLPRRHRRTLVVDRVAGEGYETVFLRGGLRVGDERKAYYRSVREPDLYAGAVLKMQLEGLGIPVAGGIVRGQASDSAEELHAFEGKPLHEVVALFMKYSNNGIAEALVKNLALAAGASEGSWQQGMPALHRRLGALGVPVAAVSLVDGSGLSYDNRVSTRALVEALRVGRRAFSLAPEFMASFPIAARDGTLDERAEAARDRVRAKTGLLNNVTGLSGYAVVQIDGEQQERVIFSALANGTRKGDQAAMDGLDAFVSQLAAGPKAAR